MFDALNAAQQLQGLLSAQHNRLISLHFPKNDGPSATLIANQLDADEGLSRDFNFTVSVLSDDPAISLKQLIGKMVTLELVRDDGSLRYFNGYVFEFSYVRNEGGYACYTMVLRPWMAFLHLRQDNYLFHTKTVREQTELIFADYPAYVDWEFRINGEDDAITDAYQYAESDHNYVHRRWEAKGWHYCYEHRVDGHKLILIDDSSLSPAIDSTDGVLAWSDEAVGLDQDGITQLSPLRQMVSGKIASASFDFKQPKRQHALDSSINSQGDVPEFEVYQYDGAFGFKHAADGERLTRLRMEEVEASGKSFSGGGNARYVQAGQTFVLGGAYDPLALGNDPHQREFLIIEAQHSANNNYLLAGDQPAEYRNQFVCQRKLVPWRPGRNFSSHTPRIDGLQTAIVVGPAGEEIHCDEYGRVRVQFHWDREGAFDEKSSAWVRVATSWSGPNFGAVAVPRIGSEVIVQFLDGNPDRPLITAMVPNAATMPPWDLPANKTQSGMLSRSTPGGQYEHANAIRFEELWLHAEKDQLTEVEHDEDKWVGNDRRKTVDHDEIVHIKHDRTETVGHDETITVHNNRTERVDHNEKISIGDNRDEDVGKNETISIGGNRTKTIAKHEKDRIGSNWSINVGKMKTETIVMASMQNVGMGRMDNVGLGYSLNVGMLMSTIVGTHQITKVGQKIAISAGEELEIKVGEASLVMKADGTILINGSTFTFEASGPVQITGKDVDIN
jgi:type VI secretion system secreted protein VgrG